jgi:hypothetical protein
MTQKVDFVKMKEARDEINRLLAERPEYKPFQEFIDLELEKAGKNHDNRMAVLNNIFWSKVKELHTAMVQLQSECQKAHELALQISRLENEKKN